MAWITFKNVFLASVVLQIVFVVVMLQLDTAPSEMSLIHEIHFFMYIVPGSILVNTFYIENFGIGLAIVLYALLMGWQHRS